MAKLFPGAKLVTIKGRPDGQMDVDVTPDEKRHGTITTAHVLFRGSDFDVQPMGKMMVCHLKEGQYCYLEGVDFVMEERVVHEGG